MPPIRFPLPSWRTWSPSAVNIAVPTAIHLAESPEEDDFLYDTTGKIAELLYPFAGWEQYLPPPRKISPTAYLDSLGALNRTTTVIHCVHVTPADAHILKRREVSGRSLSSKQRHACGR